jgi:hypothetical protein
MAAAKLISAAARALSILFHPFYPAGFCGVDLNDFRLRKSRIFSRAKPLSRRSKEGHDIASR